MNLKRNALVAQSVASKQIKEQINMSIDKTQLRELIRDILKDLSTIPNGIPYSEDAVELLMLTAAQESALGTYIHQTGSGPAQGIFQMEPRTEHDLWENFIKGHPQLSARLNTYMYDSPVKPCLLGSLPYAIAMTRIHYFRVPAVLPQANNVESLATYWKKYYNTPMGAGTVEQAIANYKRFCC